MQVIKTTITYQFILLLTIHSFAQNYLEPITSYSFRDNSVVDEAGNSQLLLRNYTSLYNDAHRGSVIRFSASSKSYAALNKNLLQSDSCTIAFFFYWESENARSWHQLFEIFDPETKSSIFFTPQNSWGDNMCSFISDKKEYSSYEAISAPPLEKDVWMHVAITIENKSVSIYINGIQQVTGNLNFTPSLLQSDSLFFGGNPHRTNNFYISARLDEIKIFDQALAANQVLALSKEMDIPAPENKQTEWETTGSAVQIIIDLEDKKQTIQNFGASDGWNTERIGKYWPLKKKEELAELLFSSEKDADGNPKGIGLSAWRFNFGAGTAEQGENSRISHETRRTEGFLNSDGITYNWSKQAGQQWFLKKAAREYNIHHVIGWQNSPPVQFTHNNLGFREYGTPMRTILKQEHFNDFARFLADVVEHFESVGVHFDYISPLNEPQYGWAPSESGGTVSQEGTPWTNQEIHDVVVAIDSEFSKRSISTKLFLTEAGSIVHLVRGSGHASNQLYHFWNHNSSLSLVGKPTFSNIVSYHSYWVDSGTALVNERQGLFDKARLLNVVPELWQSEYSLLGTGYRDGYPNGYTLTEMECALSLAKVIMADLNIANVTGWQWWTTFEKGKHGGESRFSLIEAFTRTDNSDGFFHLNKLFYSFGNFSHFIRPGMIRLGTSRSDNLSDYQATSDVMFSAFTSESNDELVLVAANFSNEARELNLNLQNASGKILVNHSLYLTDAFTNLSKQDVDWLSDKLIVPAKSVVTYTAKMQDVTSSGNKKLESDSMNAFYRSMHQDIAVHFSDSTVFQSVQLFDVMGNLLYCNSLDGITEINIDTQHLKNGIYIVTATGYNTIDSKKIMIK